MTFLRYVGVPQFFSWSVPLKVAGRPFVGAGWSVAAELFGGSISGYNAVHLLSYSLTAVLLYVLLRLFSIGPALALLAAGLKLTWTFNHSALVNHSLSIFFAECLMLVAACGLVWILNAKGAGRRYLFGLIAFVSAASLVIAVGTYQTLWPLIIVFPLLVYGVLRPVSRRRFGFIAGVWYVLFFATVLLCLIHIATFPNSLPRIADINLLTTAERVAIGLKAVLIDTFWKPFEYLWIWLDLPKLLVAAVLALGLMAPMLLRRHSGVAQEELPPGYG